MSCWLSRLWRNQTGNSSVEFALFTPLFLILMTHPGQPDPDPCAFSPFCTVEYDQRPPPFNVTVPGVPPPLRFIAYRLLPCNNRNLRPAAQRYPT